MTRQFGYSIADWFRSREPILVVAVMLVCSLAVSIAFTQQPDTAKPAATQSTKPSKPIPLYDRDPFDVVTLDEENKNARVEVCTIEMPGGKRRPFVPRADAKLVIRLLDNEDEEYEVLGKTITKVELYEELLLNEGNRLVQSALEPTNGKPKPAEEKQKLLDEAWHHFYKVRLTDPDWVGLREATDRYVFYDAGNLNAMKRYGEAIAIIEDLYVRNPTFQLTSTSPPIAEILSKLLDRILAGYFEQKNFLGMRSLLKRMDEKFGAKKPASVDAWVAKLSALAAEKRDQARQQLSQQQYRPAIASVTEMLEIWPEVEGGKKFADEVAAAYPIIFVGVTQPAKEHDALRLDDWAARRTGHLMHRMLIEFQNAGPAGGEYEFSFGSIETSEDRRKLTLKLNSTAGQEKNPITGYDIKRRVLQLANRDSTEYSAAWASMCKGVAVKNVNTVEIDLRRPHVLPESLLRVPLLARPPQANTDVEGDGPFRVQSRTDTEIQFANKSFATGGQLAELVETTYENAQKAYGALRRGNVDVVDRLFPADALRMRKSNPPDSPVQIEAYGLPTVHLLVPNLKNPFLANQQFRRGVLSAINRESILFQELMGGARHDGFQVISGPFPARSGAADPLGYAYDEETLPRPFNPMLGKALTLVAVKQIGETAKNRGDPEPKLGTLVIGYPGHEISRVACQAISAQLQVIGLQVELREFPPGVVVDAKHECDLVYEEIAFWEPVSDADRILGPQGCAATQIQAVLQKVRWLQEAQTWGDARDRLIDIHRAVNELSAILPLWQTVDFFAYNRRIKNIGSNPVWLYQNVDKWRIANVAGAE